MWECKKDVDAAAIRTLRSQMSKQKDHTCIAPWSLQTNNVQIQVRPVKDRAFSFLLSQSG